MDSLNVLLQYSDYYAVFGLVMLSGLFSGLNIGLCGMKMSYLTIIIEAKERTIKKYRKKFDKEGNTTTRLDTTEDQMLFFSSAQCHDEQDRNEFYDGYYAERIMPIKKYDNILLVTLLLGNVIVNSALAIFLDNVAGGLVGGVSATLLILFFGEILPMAICVKNALYVGYFSVNLVWMLFFLLFVVSYPVAFFLDSAVGETTDLNNRMILREMLKDEQNKNVFDKIENKVINGAFELKKTTIEKQMKGLNEIYCIDINRIITKDLIVEIYQNGYSRIPVFERDRSNIKHIFLTKDLLLFYNSHGEEMSIKDFIEKCSNLYRGTNKKTSKNTCLYLPKDTKINDALDEIQKNKIHMITVYENDPEDIYIEDKYKDQKYCIGVLTLEDIIEYILNDEIFDEDDGNDHKLLKERIIDNERFKTADAYLLDNEIKAITSYIKMNYKPFEELGSLLQSNLDIRTEFNFPKEVLEVFFRRCEILEIDKASIAYAFKNNKNKNKPKNFQILNRKSGNQNCYFILDGKIETRVGKEYMKLYKTKYNDLNFSYLEHIFETFKENIAKNRILSVQNLNKVNYTPDYDAYLESQYVRLMRIKPGDYIKLLFYVYKFKSLLQSNLREFLQFMDQNFDNDQIFMSNNPNESVRHSVNSLSSSSDDIMDVEKILHHNRNDNDNNRDRDRAKTNESNINKYKLIKTNSKSGKYYKEINTNYSGHHKNKSDKNDSSSYGGHLKNKSDKNDNSSNYGVYYKNKNEKNDSSIYGGHHKNKNDKNENFRNNNMSKNESFRGVNSMNTTYDSHRNNGHGHKDNRNNLKMKSWNNEKIEEILGD